MKKTASSVVLAAVAIALSGCSGSSTDSESSDVPKYTTDFTQTVEAGGGQVNAYVNFDDAAQLEAVYNDIKVNDDRVDGDGGWWVVIHCEGVDAKGPALATGKWAVGGLGEAQTGLSDGQEEFEVHPENTCPVT